MHKSPILIIIASILLSFPSFAQSNIKNHIPDAKKIGSSKFKVLFWHVYDATLYSSKENFSFDDPFALKLEYKRNFDGEKIAERSAEEIRKIGFNDEVRLAGWFSQMKEIFPDVSKGSYITGVYKPEGSTIFYKNNKKIGEINDKEFGRWFFGIWLNKNTSEPKLREKLLGIN
jgi:hypothetical protein